MWLHWSSTGSVVCACIDSPVGTFFVSRLGAFNDSCVYTFIISQLDPVLLCVRHDLDVVFFFDGGLLGLDGAKGGLPDRFLGPGHEMTEVGLHIFDQSPISKGAKVKGLYPWALCSGLPNLGLWYLMVLVSMVVSLTIPTALSFPGATRWSR